MVWGYNKMNLFQGTEVVMCIPDTHFPFEHPDMFDFLAKVKTKFKPTMVVHLGDEIDAHALSNYISDPNGFSAGHEHNAALIKLKQLYKIFPKVLVCTSNHTARPFRKAFSAGLPSNFLKSYSEILEAPVGWQWFDRILIDEIAYEHGEGFTGERAAISIARGNMRSTVIGHIHSFAGINYISTPEKLLFGFNVGCLIDNKAYAFAYAKNMKSKPILGCGIIHKGVPMYIPMVLNTEGKWTGVV